MNVDRWNTKGGPHDAAIDNFSTFIRVLMMVVRFLEGNSYPTIISFPSKML